MAVTAYKYPGTMAESGSDNAWLSQASLDNMKAEDTNCGINASLPSGGGLTNYAQGTNFGFTTADVPAGSTIDGIEVGCNAISNRASGTYDDVNLLGVTGTPTGKGNGIALNNSSTCGDGVDEVFGSSSDVWGSGVTAADVVSSGFGVQGRWANGHASLTCAIRAEYFKIRIHYTAPSSGPPSGTLGLTGVGK